MTRYPLIDQIRGFTVYLMIFFHISYDLNALNYYSFDVMNNPFWFWLPRTIVFLFLFCVGLSLFIVHNQKIKIRSFFKRLLKVSLAAVLVTLGTYLAFPQHFIYFGTLHCIALSSLVTIPLVKFPRLSLTIALAILGLHTLGIQIPFYIRDHQSMDYIPLFPWVSFVLLGFFAASMNLHTVINRQLTFLEWPGKKSLIIYLLHQPIIFGTLFLIRKLI